MAISDYSTTPGNNVTIGGVNIAEQCPPGNLNDAVRQMMADLATFNAAPSFGGGVTIGGNANVGGVVLARTPSDASTGGFRLMASPVTGFAHFQVLDSAGTSQWGFWRYTGDGAADWFGTAGIQSNGKPVWHAGNDGNGSGLDADMLDGLHATALIPTGNLAPTGYCFLPNGLVFQWGTISVGGDSYGTVTFPTTFPTACVYIAAGVGTEIGNTNAQANGPAPYAVTRTGASLWNPAPTATAWWLAMGH